MSIILKGTRDFRDAGTVQGEAPACLGQVAKSMAEGELKTAPVLSARDPITMSM
jgi:hypothetical protein